MKIGEETKESEGVIVSKPEQGEEEGCFEFWVFLGVGFPLPLTSSICSLFPSLLHFVIKLDKGFWDLSS